MTNRYSRGADAQEETKPPLFRTDIILAIPNVMMRPSLEDIQAVLNKSIQVILKMTENVPQWEHLCQQQRQQQKVMKKVAVCWCGLSACLPASLLAGGLLRARVSLLSLILYFSV